MKISAIVETHSWEFRGQLLDLLNAGDRTRDVLPHGEDVRLDSGEEDAPGVPRRSRALCRDSGTETFSKDAVDEFKNYFL